eukprot:1550865-Rhodomonas_salina.8
MLSPLLLGSPLLSTLSEPVCTSPGSKQHPTSVPDISQHAYFSTGHRIAVAQEGRCYPYKQPPPYGAPELVQTTPPISTATRAGAYTAESNQILVQSVLESSPVPAHPHRTLAAYGSCESATSACLVAPYARSLPADWGVFIKAGSGECRQIAEFRRQVFYAGVLAWSELLAPKRSRAPDLSADGHNLCISRAGLLRDSSVPS